MNLITTRRAWGTAIIALLGLVSVSATAHAGPVCAVVSKRIPPYLQALKGLKESVGEKVEVFNLDGKRERGGEVVGKIIDNDCSVIVPIGSLALDVICLQVRNRPIIYTMVLTPSETARRAANVSGVSIEPSPRELFSVLKRLLPNATRVGVVYNPANVRSYMERARQAAQAMGITLDERKVSTIKAMPSAVTGVLPSVDAMLMVPDPTTSSRKAFEYLLLESTRRGVPLIGLSGKHVRDGALYSFALDYLDTGRATGEIVQRALSVRPHGGAQHEAGGVLVINAKAAKRLGLRVDPALLEQAGKVYR